MFSHKSRSILVEIRLRWAEKVIQEDPSVAPLGRWRPATQLNRDKLAFAADIGNRRFGPGSHWIEERQA